jgi:hypothetical protein
MIFCPQTSHTLQLLTRNQKQWTNESVTLTVCLESLDCRTPKKKFQRPLTAALTAALTVALTVISYLYTRGSKQFTNSFLTL